MDGYELIRLQPTCILTTVLVIRTTDQQFPISLLSSGNQFLMHQIYIFAYLCVR